MTETPHTGNKRDLVVTRLFNAPLSLVWKAWSDPAYVMQWWGPHGFRSPLAKIDFREGATSLVCMSSPEYGDHYSTWQYEKIVPLQRIEYIHNLADKDGNKVDPVTMGMQTRFPAGSAPHSHFQRRREWQDGNDSDRIQLADWPHAGNVSIRLEAVPR